MFQTGIARVDYKDPWTEPFQQRLHMLCRRGARRRAGLSLRTARHQHLPLPCDNMIEVLSLTQPNVAAAWFTEAEIERLAEFIGICDALVICRFRYTQALNHLVTRAAERRRGHDIRLRRSGVRQRLCPPDPEHARPETRSRRVGSMVRLHRPDGRGAAPVRAGHRHQRLPRMHGDSVRAGQGRPCHPQFPEPGASGAVAEHLRRQARQRLAPRRAAASRLFQRHAIAQPRLRHRRGRHRRADGREIRASRCGWSASWTSMARLPATPIASIAIRCRISSTCSASWARWS